MSAVAEHAMENHHPIHWEEITVLDSIRPLQRTTEIPWLLDRCDEEAEREEQFSPPMMCILSSACL